MRYVGDFHIHSHYSRATSKDMNIEELDRWARIKGIDVLGTGDFTHPKWFRELQEKLEPAEEGLFKLKIRNPKSEIRNKSEIHPSAIQKPKNLSQDSIGNLFSALARKPE